MSLELQPSVVKLDINQEGVYTKFDVVNSGSGVYQFNTTGIGFTQNTLNPPLYLNRGQHYQFNVNGWDTHSTSRMIAEVD